MSKIDQIEARLLELDGGAFQRLCNAYLRKKGYDQINSLGSVPGSDKARKGTPDTFVPLPNGKYLFAEYTTQQDRLHAKLDGDLDKCLDERKCGLPTAKIERVVFCHTSQLTPQEHESLATKCQNAGINFEVSGLSVIASDLYEKYPGLARDHLQVEVDTGQIVSAEEFVRAYGRNGLATPLNTAFRFREKEISDAMRALETQNLLLVTGRAGVGKSRFALECCARFAAAHSSYVVRCIFNRGPDIYQDLRVHFSQPGRYLILVDDANRMSHFEYVLQLLASDGEQTQVKIVATVRDYAVGKIKNRSVSSGGVAELELKPLDDKQIKEMVRDEYEITNELYLQRIAHVAHGNARLAVMAAIVACHEDRLSSIDDVTKLYDEYYASIRADLQELDDRSLLKVAAIVAFFRNVDRTNSALMDAISTSFAVSPEDFWRGATRLHQMEILDMCENEIVRVSDQVLATYMFYLAFFRERALSFGDLLANFFPQHQGRFVDSIFPVLDAFDGRAIVRAMRPYVSQRWDALEQSKDRQGLLQLMGMFWFVKETDTLVCLKRWIDEIEIELIAPADVNVAPVPLSEGPSIPRVLAKFRNSDDTNVRIVLGLLIDYATRRPTAIPQILHTITQTFGFDHRDALYGFRVQKIVVDVLRNRACVNGELCARIFLAVAEDYLRTYFSSTESSGSKTFIIHQFTLPHTSEVKAIRQYLWEGVFSLYGQENLQQKVLQLIHKQRDNAYRASRELVADDAQRVLAFVEANLDSTRYSHCVVVQNYLAFLRQCGLPVNTEIEERFKNDTRRVAEVLTQTYHDVDHAGVNHEEFEKQKAQRLADLCKTYNLGDFRHLINQCEEIQRQALSRHDEWVLRGSMVTVLCALADRDAELYSQVLREYLGKHDPLGLPPYFLVQRLLMFLGPDSTYDVLGSLGCSSNQWMGVLFQCLKREQITMGWVERLLHFYATAALGGLPGQLDFLLNYSRVAKDIFPKVTRIVLDRTEREPTAIHALTTLLLPGTDFADKIVDLYEGNTETLKRAYVAASEVQEYFDYDGQILSRIIDEDPVFLKEFIRSQYHDSKSLRYHGNPHKFAFLWKRDDYRLLGAQLIEELYDCKKGCPSFLHAELGAFCIGEEDSKVEPAIMEKQNEVIKDLLGNRHGELAFMRFLFGMLSELGPERRRAFLAHFLDLNKSFETFQHLALEPMCRSWSGSAVPMYQRSLEYFESLLPLVDSVILLKHKQLLEKHMEGLRAMIEHEKKQDFMEED